MDLAVRETEPFDRNSEAKQLAWGGEGHGAMWYPRAREISRPGEREGTAWWLENNDIFGVESNPSSDKRSGRSRTGVS